MSGYSGGGSRSVVTDYTRNVQARSAGGRKAFGNVCGVRGGHRCERQCGGGGGKSTD